jgi:hypothetical protein
MASERIRLEREKAQLVQARARARRGARPRRSGCIGARALFPRPRVACALSRRSLVRARALSQAAYASGVLSEAQFSELEDLQTSDCLTFVAEGAARRGARGAQRQAAAHLYRPKKRARFPRPPHVLCALFLRCASLGRLRARPRTLPPAHAVVDTFADDTPAMLNELESHLRDALSACGGGGGGGGGAGGDDDHGGVSPPPAEAPPPHGSAGAGAAGAAAAAAAEMAAARAVLHKLKGSALTLGAARMGAACEAVRACCIAGDVAAALQPGGAPGTLGALTASFQELMGA